MPLGLGITSRAAPEARPWDRERRGCAVRAPRGPAGRLSPSAGDAPSSARVFATSARTIRTSASGASVNPRGAACFISAASRVVRRARRAVAVSWVRAGRGRVRGMAVRPRVVEAEQGRICGWGGGEKDWKISVTRGNASAIEYSS